MSQTLLLPGQWAQLQARKASSDFLLPVGTAWVSKDVLGISEEISRRWPSLRVASCDCGRCVAAGHEPHAVVEHCRDGVTRPVFGFRQFDRRVITRLHQIHASQDPLKEVQAKNEALRARFEKEAAEAKAAALEEPIAALSNSRTAWRGSDGKTYTPHGVKE